MSIFERLFARKLVVVSTHQISLLITLVTSTRDVELALLHYLGSNSSTAKNIKILLQRTQQRTSPVGQKNYTLI